MDIAIVGATGLVGRTLLAELEASEIRIDNLYLFASPKSAGKRLSFRQKEYPVEALSESALEGKSPSIISSVRMLIIPR